MEQSSNYSFFFILQNPDTGRTIRAIGTNELTANRRDAVTSKELEFVDLGKWQEPDTGEQFITQGIEILDGVSSKTYSPVPDQFYRFRFDSGRMIFAVMRDGRYVDVFTDVPFDPFASSEDWVLEIYFEGRLSRFMRYGDEANQEYESGHA